MIEGEVPRYQLGEPIADFEGEGKVSFEDGFESEATFRIQQFHSGTIAGNVHLPSVDYFRIHRYFEKGTYFELVGRTKENDEDILITGCSLLSITGSKNIDARIDAREATISLQVLSAKPTNTIVLRYGLLNVGKTFRVIDRSDRQSIDFAP